MARFDVYQYEGRDFNLVLDLQANILSDLETRIVIPLYPVNDFKQEIQETFRPVLVIENKRYILMTTSLATILVKNLGTQIANIGDEHYKIMNAVDFLFQGF